MISFELVHAYDGINLYRGGAGAKLELNRPERLNALNEQLARQLLVLLQEAAADPVRALGADHRRGPRLLRRQRHAAGRCPPTPS